MTQTLDTGATPGRGPEAPGEWHALHVFYSADARPILTDCVAPLIADLRARDLLERWFFINYWMEGGHVRLRLKPRTAGVTGEVQAAAEEAITAFLARRPALYSTDYAAMAPFYDQMFALEYSDEERERLFPDGRMPIQDNNTFQYRPYEPEYAKYGGEAGIEIAEWHFEHSSDLVLRLVQTMNVHVRSIMLGLSAQIMMIMTSTFLRDPEEMAGYFERYHAYWSKSFDLSDDDTAARYEKNYAQMHVELKRRFTEVHGAVQDGDLSRLTSFRHTWAAHCAELRDRVLAAKDRMVFPPRFGPGEPKPIASDSVLLPYVLTPYMHMTNNRLGATLIDEAYLSYVLGRALRELG